MIKKIVRRIRREAQHLRSRWFQWQLRRTTRRIAIGETVRFNVPVRNGGAGSLVIGEHNCFGYPLAARLGSGEILLQARNAGSEITIGEGNTFSNNISIVANQRVTIGNHCVMGDQVAIIDCDFHELSPETRNRSAGHIRPVHIGNNVWLGSRVMVLKGVTIGDNSVIGAMSMVNKSIPPNCLAAGFPARVVRRLDEPPEKQRRPNETISSCV
jgi:maltose O-acetyltransferase